MSGKLLILAGKNGNGKTHCAKRVAKWIRHVGPGKQWVQSADVIGSLSATYWHWPGFLDALKNGGWDLVEDCIRTPCLILDELGGGHDPSSVGADKLCQILSRREKRWTLLTTNISPTAWAKAFDNRIASRMFRNSKLVDLSDVPDYCGIL